MKYIKTYEDSITDSLISIFYSNVAKDNKIINGYECFYDNLSGAIEWTNDKYIIYATPYYNEYNELPITITNLNDNGDPLLNEIKPFMELKTINDIKIAKDEYYNIIDEITQMVPELIKGANYNL